MGYRLTCLPVSQSDTSGLPPSIGGNVVLTKAVNSLLLSAVKDTTRAAYTTGFQSYTRFLNINGVLWPTAQLPPINESILIYYVAHCFHNLHLQ